MHWKLCLDYTRFSVIFLGFCQKRDSLYIDLIECENMGLEVNPSIHNDNKFRIKHIPSWHFDAIDKESIDLVTGTWVLNELTVSGALWIMSHLSSVLRKGGYLYIRDGARIRENSLNFDDLAQEVGFKEISRLNVRNRIELQGIPRVYQKTDNSVYTFDSLVEKSLGEFDSPVHDKYNRKSG